MTKDIQNIVITGDNLASWQCALSLTRLMPFVELNIRVVSKAGPNQDDTVIVATPTLAYFHRLLALDEREFMRRCDARFHLANAYTFDQAHPFYIGYADSPRSFNGIGVQHLVSRLMSDSSRASDDPILNSLAGAAERAGKFGFSKNPDIAEQLVYGYCFSSRQYTQYMTELALNAGVQFQQVDELSWCDIDGKDYQLSTVIGEVKSKVNADLFIDCSSEAFTLESFIPILNISEYREKTVKIDSLDGPTWVADGLHYSAQYHFNDNKLSINAMSRTHAYSRMMNIESISSPGGSAQEGCWGYLANPWQRNRLRVGPAASNLGELAIPTLQVVQSSILRLLDLFPSDVSMKTCAQEFNALSRQECERVIEFHLIQLFAPLLAEDATAEKLGAISDVLSNKLSVFKTCGIFPLYEGESLGSDIWVSLLLHCGVVPKHYDPVLDNFPILSVSTFLSQQASLIEGTVKVMPVHDEYLLQYLAVENRGFK